MARVRRKHDEQEGEYDEDEGADEHRSLHNECIVWGNATSEATIMQR